MMKKQTLAIVVLLCSITAARAQWDFSNAEPLPFATSLTGKNLAINDEGTLHAVLLQGNALRCFYKTADSPEWIAQGVANDSSGVPLLGDHALAWNPSTARPTVVYTSNHQLWLAQQEDGAIWTRSLLSDSGEVSMTPDLAINNTGQIFVVYVIGGNGIYQLKYAYFDGVSWSSDVIEADLGAFGAGAMPRAGLQDNGAAHAAFRAEGVTGYKVLHATNNEAGGTTWALTDLQVPHPENYPGDLAVEPDGTVHCVTQGSDGFGMPAPAFYHHRTPDGTWADGVAVSNPLDAGDPTVAFDTQHGGHAMWLPLEGNFYTGELFYSGENSVWTPHFVHDNVGSGACFVIDGENSGHILVETGGGDVVYLKSEQPLAGETPEPELTIVPRILDFDSVEVGRDSSIAVRLENSGAATLTLSGFEVAGTAYSGPPQWIVVNLAPGAFMTTEVLFTPSADQTYLGRALVWSNAASSPDTIHLTGRGYLETDVPSATTPSEFTLHSLYPNPFNGGVTVAFELPRAMPVELGVYDVLGRHVETLVSGRASAGSHVVQWRGGDRAAGIYLIKLEADGQAVVRKAMYLK